MTDTTVKTPTKGRARLTENTLRTDRWWQQPLINGIVLAVIVIYLTVVSLINKDYSWEPYISPMYSPCLATTCAAGAGYSIVPWLTWLTPAIIIIGGPMGFRVTCYYYRKAYYRSFWAAPAACGVKEPHGKYTGERRFPLILQNAHRYFFWIAILFNCYLTYDAVLGFKNHQGHWGHMGLGTVVLIINAITLWTYSLSCHACRHAVGGRIKHFSKHPLRYRMWSMVSKMNPYHMQFAWISLVWVALTDLYIRLVASGVITDPRFF